MTLIKTENILNNQIIHEGLTKINLPSFCDLNTLQSCLDYENITITVHFILFYRICLN